MEKLKAVAENFGTVNVQAVIVGLVCLAILIVWPFVPKVGEIVPGSLIAVFAGIGMVSLLHMKVNTIGDLYTISNSLPSFRMPDFSIKALRECAGNAFTIAILAAIESLLSCVVADGMINAHHRPDAELVAQGLGNIGSAFFGGIPATGAIARTAANIKNGGRTPIAGIVHAIVLVLVLIVLMPYAALIPMPTIAAILFLVAYNMCGWRTFVHLCKTAPKSDIAILVTTFVLTVGFDLVIAIGAGMVLSCLFLMKRMADETSVVPWQYIDAENDPDSIDLRVVPKHVRVFEINGPLFFGAAERIAEINLKEYTKVLVIRMRAVPALDATAMHSLENLYHQCSARNVTMVFSHVNEQPMHTMEKAGFVEKVGRENFAAHIDAALARAEEIN
jgi:SulP family sulfate permease